MMCSVLHFLSSLHSPLHPVGATAPAETGEDNGEDDVIREDPLLSEAKEAFADVAWASPDLCVRDDARQPA